MEEVKLPHLSGVNLSAGLYLNVQNGAFLRTQLLEGNARFEYAFLDASTVLSRGQVLAACFRSINDLKIERLKTRNVHSEIVFSLSPNNNIAESFRRFGISDTTKNIIAIKVGSSLDEVTQHLNSVIEGTPVSFTEENLSSLRDEARISKIYRIDAPQKGERKPLDKQAEAFVIGSMALRGS